MVRARIALHLYGDASAHREMGELGDDPDKVYPTGRGHAVHAHYPDWPLCGQLKRKSVVYLLQEPATPFSTSVSGDGRNTGGRPRIPGAWRALDQNAHDSIVAKVFVLSATATDSNDWGEAGMADVLVEQAQAERSEQTRTQRFGEFLPRRDRARIAKTF